MHAQTRAPETGRATVLEVDGLGLEPTWEHDRGLRLEGVTFDVFDRETLGIVGEPGNGSSEVLAVLAGITHPTEGRIRIDGVNPSGFGRRELREHRARIGFVCGDPTDPLDMFPANMSVRRAVSEPLELHKHGPRRERILRAEEAMETVDLDPSMADARPRDLAPPDRVRVALARAVALRPGLLLLDRPVDALEPLDRARILSLVCRLRDELGLACVLTSDHPATAAGVADRIAVMFGGRTVELAETPVLVESPSHPYTFDLLCSVPLPHPAREARRPRPAPGWTAAPVPGREPPSGTEGCCYASRCPRAQDRCHVEAPRLGDPGLGHPVACHFPETIARVVSPLGED